MHVPQLLAMVVALSAAVAGAGGGQQASNQNSTPQEVLKSSIDRDELERAATSLARSGNANDLFLLGQLLRNPSFLARLDDLSGFQTRHLSRVMKALAEHPTPEVVELCLTLAEDPAFVAQGDRKSFVLELLAGIKPMSEKTAYVIQRSNEEGYFAFNARLLTNNRSPRALALFESMMLDTDVPAESRVQCLHVSIVPARRDPAILRTADHILSRTAERAIAEGVTESVFDFRQNWFGIESGISEPPSWRTAAIDALRSASALADKALARRDLHPRLRNTVQRARELIARALSARSK